MQKVGRKRTMPRFQNPSTYYFENSFKFLIQRFVSRKIHRVWSCLIPVLLLSALPSTQPCFKSDGANQLSPESWTPVPRREAWWQSYHQSFNMQSLENGTLAKIVFFGDSITDGWRHQGNETFDKFYSEFSALNYGLSGDRTQHLLWRIKNGEVVNLRPKLIILLIGTNNMGFNNNAEIAAGVKSIISELRQRLPMSKIMLLGILPRNSPELTKRITQINKMIMQLDDGVMVWYFDLGRYFFIEDRLVQELYQTDLLHLSSKGYEMWAMAMNPILKEMLEITFESD